jgi:hypothetical protein
MARLKTIKKVYKTKPGEDASPLVEKLLREPGIVKLRFRRNNRIVAEFLPEKPTDRQ